MGFRSKFGLLCYFLFLLSLISSCETRLMVDNQLIEASSSSKVVTIHIDANSDWTATSSAEWWCKVDPKEGKKDVKKMTVSVLTNDTYAERECAVKIVSKDKSISITVKQEQNDAIILETNQIAISGEEQDFIINVSSNVRYLTSVFNDWIKIKETKALQNSVVTLHADANSSLESRKGLVRVVDANRQEIIGNIQIVQQPLDTIIVSLDPFLLSWEGNRMSISAKASVDFTVRVPEEYPWLHANRFGNYKECQIMVSADEFVLLPDDKDSTTQSYRDREGEILLEYGDGKRVRIPVIQQFKDYIWLDPHYLEIYEGNSRSLMAEAIFHDGINNNLLWRSNDASIVHVDNTGTIIGQKKGEASIIVSNEEDNYRASCLIRVKGWLDDVVEEREPNGDNNYINMIPYGKRMRFRLSNAYDVDIFSFTRPAYTFYVKFTYEGDSGDSNGIEKLISYTLYNSNWKELSSGNPTFYSEGSVVTQHRWLDTSTGYIRICVHDHAKLYPQMVPTGYFVLEFTTEE